MKIFRNFASALLFFLTCTLELHAQLSVHLVADSITKDSLYISLLVQNLSSKRLYFPTYKHKALFNVSSNIKLRGRSNDNKGRIEDPISIVFTGSLGKGAPSMSSSITEDTSMLRIYKEVFSHQIEDLKKFADVSEFKFTLNTSLQCSNLPGCGIRSISGKSNLQNYYFKGYDFNRDIILRYSGFDYLDSFQKRTISYVTSRKFLSTYRRTLQRENPIRYLLGCKLRVAFNSVIDRKRLLEIYGCVPDDSVNIWTGYILTNPIKVRF